MCSFENIGRMLAKAHVLGYSCQINENGDSIDFSNSFGRFTLRCFGGTVFVAESCNVWIDYHNRGTGLGQQQHLDRLEIAKAAGLLNLIATVNDENVCQVHIMNKNKWVKLSPVGKTKTNVWIKELT